MTDLNTLLNSGVVEVGVEWGDEVVSVSARSDALTPLLIAKVQEAASGGAEATALVDFCAAIIADWDVVDNGAPFPPTPENIATLPVTFLVAVLQACMKVVVEDIPLTEPASVGS